MINLKKRIGYIRTALKEIYAKPFYIVLSLVVALILIIFNISIVNYKIFLNFPSFEIVRNIFFGTFYTLPIHSIIFLFMAAILTGILIPLLVYHIKNLRGLDKSYAAGSGGAILGIVAPACSSCGIGLVALLGFTGLLGSLPFAGVEVGVLGIALLMLAIISLSGKIANKTCIPKKNYMSKLFKRR